MNDNIGKYEVKAVGLEWTVIGPDMTFTVAEYSYRVKDFWVASYVAERLNAGSDKSRAYLTAEFWATFGEDGFRPAD